MADSLAPRLTSFIEQLKINAYILAADPAWIEASVLSYYDHVERIIVSYDVEGRGWTGVPIDVEQCLSRLRAIDKDAKFDYRPGHFARAEFFNQPMANDTNQRRVAVEQASDGVDWVLQLDTDEVVLQPQRLVEVLEEYAASEHLTVEWPMRVLFRQLRSGDFLEVCAPDGADYFEYPGPIAIRRGAVPSHARRVEGAYLRIVVRGDDRSLQIAKPPSAEETRIEAIDSSEAIVHNSWAEARRAFVRR